VAVQGSPSGTAIELLPSRPQSAEAGGEHGSSTVDSVREDLMKFCKDCKHFDQYHRRIDLSGCKRLSKTSETSPIDGSITVNVHFCSSERDNPRGECGPNALLFEPAVAELDERR
jgi:hypothetical protein